MHIVIIIIITIIIIIIIIIVIIIIVAIVIIIVVAIAIIIIGIIVLKRVIVLSFSIWRSNMQLWSNKITALIRQYDKNFHVNNEKYYWRHTRLKIKDQEH